MPDSMLSSAGDRIRGFYNGLSTPARTALLGGVLGGGAGLAAQRLTRGDPDETGKRRSIVSPLTAALLGAAGGAGMSWGDHLMTTPGSTSGVFGAEPKSLGNAVPASAALGGVAGGALGTRAMARRAPGTAALGTLRAELKALAPGKGQQNGKHQQMVAEVNSAMKDVKDVGATRARFGAKKILNGAGEAFAGAGKAVGHGVSAAGAAIGGARGAQNPHTQRLLVALGQAGKGVSTIGNGLTQVGRGLTDPITGGTGAIRKRVLDALAALEKADPQNFHPGRSLHRDLRLHAGTPMSARRLAITGAAGAGAGAAGGYLVEQILRKALENVI